MLSNLSLAAMALVQAEAIKQPPTAPPPQPTAFLYAGEARAAARTSHIAPVQGAETERGA